MRRFIGALMPKRAVSLYQRRLATKVRVMRRELRPPTQLHVPLLAVRIIQILRHMLDPLRRLAQRNRHLLGPVRGGSQWSLRSREFGFEFAHAGVGLGPFVGEGNRCHDDEALVADLAETLPKGG